MNAQDTIGGLKPYSRYRPSGVEWLGDVPEYWEVVQLGRIGTFSKGSGGTKDDEVLGGIPCVRYGDLYTTHKSFISQTRSYVSPAKASAYTPIIKGDVLFPTSGETIEEIGKSAVNLMDARVVCGGDLIIFRPTVPIDPRFAGYALDCPDAQTQKSLMGRGITIMHIYSGQLKYLWLALPPPPEQRAIVRYLDYVDRRIRRYVSRQAEAHCAAGGGEAGRRQPGRHPRPRPQRPPQALRRRVARRRAGALADAAVEDCCVHACQ